MGSPVVETATQFQNGLLVSSSPLVVNCERIQRSVIWSYMTTGSPDGSVQSGTANPLHTVPVSTGPSSLFPLLS